MVNIDIEKCTGCGKCVKDCFSGNIIIKDDKAQIVNTECMLCGHCVAICPAAAAVIPEYDMADVADIPDIIEQNISPEGLLAFIKTRRSIRQYKDKSVAPELIKQIIEAGRYTATASNRQELTFIVVEKEMQKFRSLVIENLSNLGREKLKADDLSPLQKRYALWWMAIERSYKKNPEEKDVLFFNAPVVLLVAGDHQIDAGLAASNMELVACANKLGVLYSGFIAGGCGSEKVKNAFSVPPEKEVLIALLIGYPDVEYKRTAPRKVADTVWL